MSVDSIVSVSTLDSFASEHIDGAWFIRGESRLHEKGMRCSADRADKPFDDRSAIEDFRRTHYHQVTSEEQRFLDQENLLAPQVVMQHRGRKTRLLDWTTDFRVGVFFAVDGDPREDAFVYCFNSNRFHDAIEKQLGAQTEAWREFRGSDSTLQLAANKLYAVRCFDRIIRQSGCFTYSGASGVCHWSSISETLSLASDPAAIRSYRIPAANKPSLVEALRLCEITKASLGLTPHSNRSNSPPASRPFCLPSLATSKTDLRIWPNPC